MQTKYTLNPFKGERAAGERIFFARLPRRITSSRLLSFARLCFRYRLEGLKKKNNNKNK